MNKRLSAIYGAMIGDYYGSYWEFLTEKPTGKDDALALREGQHSFTDDTIATLAIADALSKAKKDKNNEYDYDKEFASLVCSSLKSICRQHPSSFGGRFFQWVLSDKNYRTHSWGNGASMRISPVGIFSDSEDEVRSLTKAVTDVTHDHLYSSLFAEIVAMCIFWAKKGLAIGEIKSLLSRNYPMEYEKVSKMDLEDLHQNYSFNETSHDTVPQALYCFLSSKSFEDCLARSLYIGGDSDTLCAISCSIAAEYYGEKEVMPFYKNIEGEIEGWMESIMEKFDSSVATQK